MHNHFTVEEIKYLAILLETEEVEDYFFVDYPELLLYNGNEDELTEEWQVSKSEENFETWLYETHQDCIIDLEEYQDWKYDYQVYTDQEADEAWEEYLDSYIDDCVLLDIPKQYHSYFDDEAFKRDCKYDGRGHSLASYDGNEQEQTIDGVTYYLYKIN